MQQKEVLIVVSVLVAGFFLLNNNGILSGRATYTNTLNYVTEPVPYGGGAGLGTGATISCPPPKLLGEDCVNVGPHYGRPEDTSAAQIICDFANTLCQNCVGRACSNLRRECAQHCTGLLPGEHGPALPCTPEFSCYSWACTPSQNPEPGLFCEYRGGAIASCICLPMLTSED